MRSSQARRWCLLGTAARHGTHVIGVLHEILSFLARVHHAPGNPVHLVGECKSVFFESDTITFNLRDAACVSGVR
ncbi:unannotated protein [freshwater metagenome]|uniref:Unannotated protein n=1 Tax=freshwater metagenome TaxID=449393 RepID=A0A6J6NN61_9ZZZZ